jgi:ferredoxin
MSEVRLLPFDRLQDLIDALAAGGRRCIGPVVENGVPGLAVVESVFQFPRGVIDHQSPGRFRLEATFSPAVFDARPGFASWKSFLLPPETLLFKALKTVDGVELRASETVCVPTAFVGVRPCDLHALEVLDLVFLENPAAEAYRRRRRELFLVVVNCSRPAATCFCRSLGTGPQATAGYDICLTELADPDNHRFLLAVGSEAGRALVEELGLSAAGAGEVQRGLELLDKAASEMTGKPEVAELGAVIYKRLDHPLWRDTAERCLACGSCTMVCPTCFCTTVRDKTDLSGNVAERRRVWDSCFNRSFSYLHGGSVRESLHSRYRNFVLHKLGTWVEQFGRPGCVGCGRCITWCPAGIDITAVAAGLRHRADPGKPGKEVRHVTGR